MYIVFFIYIYSAPQNVNGGSSTEKSTTNEQKHAGTIL